jgi:hypothetical protein
MAFLIIPGGTFIIQSVLQLLLSLMVEFLVFTWGLTSLLPKLISPPDNIYLFGCRHGLFLKPVAFG